MTRRELEGERLEREELEREAAQERVMAEEVRAQVSVLRREVEQAAALRARETEAVEREKEKSANLQSVLEDFQLGESTGTKVYALLIRGSSKGHGDSTGAGRV